MTPRQQVLNLYWRFPQPRDFQDDYLMHQVSGYVIDTPEAFLMGRGVDRYQDEEVIRCPHVIFPRSRQNAWFIWAFAGDISLMGVLAPYELPYVGWARRNGPIRWYESGRVLETVNRHYARHGEAMHRDMVRKYT